MNLANSFAAIDVRESPVEITNMADLCVSMTSQAKTSIERPITLQWSRVGWTAAISQ